MIPVWNAFICDADIAEYQIVSCADGETAASAHIQWTWTQVGDHIAESDKLVGNKTVPTAAGFVQPMFLSCSVDEI